MKLHASTCPNCGASLTVSDEQQKTICAYCGSEILIDIDNHLNRSNAEAIGYEFEKGRQKAQQEYWNNNQAMSAAPGAAYPKKRHTLLWVLGWIFIFPIPLTIITVKTENLSIYIKALIIIAAWAVYLMIGLLR